MTNRDRHALYLALRVHATEALIDANHTNPNDDQYPTDFWLEQADRYATEMLEAALAVPVPVLAETWQEQAGAEAA